MSGKTSGLGDNFYVGGYDLSGAVNAVDTITGGPALLDFTTINKSAVVRQGGQRSGEIDFTTFMDVGGTPSTHIALSALPTSDTVVTYFRGTAVGNPAANLYGKQINYDPTRGTDGSLTLKVQAMSNGYGVEWGDQLTAGLRTDTSGTVPTTGTAIDYGAGSSFGGQAYLQVTAMSGTSATVIVEHSTDNSTYSTLLTFNAATAAPWFDRQATGASTTVNEYVRATSTVMGGGTAASLTFAVAFVKNATTVTF